MARGGTDPSRLALAGRIGVSLVVLAYMIASPLIRELHISHSRHFPEWKMFHWASTNPPTCTVEFFDDEGPLDRFTLLGIERRFEAPIKRRRLMGARAVYDQGRRFCSGHGGESRAVYARAQCATMAGWKAVYDGSEDLCTAKAPPAPRTKNKNKNKNKPKRAKPGRVNAARTQ